LNSAGESAYEENTPNSFKTHRINRMKQDFNDFSFKGRLDGKNCFFKIDTGSDVSILSKRLAQNGKRRIINENCYLRYPTGEKIFIETKVVAKVQLGSYSVEISLFVAEINDDCLLGIDFFKIIKII